MARVKNDKIKGFVLSFEDDNGYIVDLRFISSHHCEMVLRGLVHSGFKVTSSEEIFDMPGRCKATYRFDEYGDVDGNHTHSIGATLNLTEIDEPAPITSPIWGTVTLPRMTDAIPTE